MSRQQPQLSAIMITGHRPERRHLALHAVKCFRQQTLPDGLRELVIINTGEPLSLPDHNIHEFLIQQTPSTTLGDLRNHAFDLARGEWLIQWDDDDWHHPRRCEVQLDMTAPHQEKCVLLESQIRYNLLTDSHYIFSCKSGIVGTILHHRQIPWRYPPLARGEDGHFAHHFIKRKIIRGKPELYCRFYHGANTWSEDHIMTPTSSCKATSQAHETFLQEHVLPGYL